MNGIDYSSLMSNTGLFSNQTTSSDEVKFKGNLTGVSSSSKKAKSASKADSTKQTNADQDTYEHSTQTKEVKAGYDRPKRVQSEQSQYKQIDSDGIQEGIELSDAAKNLLAELREKYGDTMEISVANWSTDEESDYYASLTSKDYSVLINPELLEKMAADESVREQYESILSGAGDASDQIKEELGEDADKISSFSITIDADGNVSYAVKLLQDMTENNKAQQKQTAAEKQQERIEEKRAEKKKAEKERQEKLAEKKETEKKEAEKIEAGSIDELIAAIKNKLNPQQASETSDEEDTAEEETSEKETE
jgi:hypothetical protein